jgi:hypothetical protein
MPGGVAGPVVANGSVNVQEQTIFVGTAFATSRSLVRQQGLREDARKMKRTEIGQHGRHAYRMV